MNDRFMPPETGMAENIRTKPEGLAARINRLGEGLAFLEDALDEHEQRLSPVLKPSMEDTRALKSEGSGPVYSPLAEQLEHAIDRLGRQMDRLRTLTHGLDL